MRQAQSLPFAYQRKTTELFAILPLHPFHPAAISPTCGPIAQLDRVPDYESGGRGFESSSVHQKQVIWYYHIKYKLEMIISLSIWLLCYGAWVLFKMQTKSIPDIPDVGGHFSCATV